MITFVHTMLKSHKYTKMSKCLVVCPLNTVLNWVNEFEIWLEDVDFKVEVKCLKLLVFYTLSIQG